MPVESHTSTDSARRPDEDLAELARLVAAEVVRLLELPTHSDETLIDAREVARRHGIDRAWVYAHADELGALRLGTGSRPRLRFDPAIVRDVLTNRHPPAATAPTTKPRPRKPRSDVELLPIGPKRRVKSPRAA
jgi:hypothetical protein